MKAAVLAAIDEPLRVIELQPLPLGPTEARIRVQASGVCGSDLHRMTGTIPAELPMVLGHEACGTVLEVGPAVRTLRPGDRVVATSNPECGSCWFCLHGQPNLCERTRELRSRHAGLDPRGGVVWSMAGLGSFRSEMNVDQTMLVKVETDLPDEELALLGCGVTTGLGAVLNTASVNPGASVAILGCGGVGLASVQGAALVGATRIVAIDPVPERRRYAAAMGATEQVDPGATDPVEAVRELTHGRGVDYAFEMVGSPATILQARAMTRAGGTTVLVGAPAKSAEVTFNAWDLHVEGRILGCSNGSARVGRDLPRFVALAESGRLKLGPMITDRIALDDINDAFDQLRAGKGIRTVVTALE